MKIFAIENTSVAVARNLGLWESFKRNNRLAMLDLRRQYCVDKLVSLGPILLWGTDIFWTYFDKALCLRLLGRSCHFVIEDLLGLSIVLNRDRLHLILSHLDLRQLNKSLLQRHRLSQKLVRTIHYPTKLLLGCPSKPSTGDKTSLQSKLPLFIIHHLALSPLLLLLLLSTTVNNNLLIRQSTTAND